MLAAVSLREFVHMLVERATLAKANVDVLLAWRLPWTFRPKT